MTDIIEELLAFLYATGKVPGAERRDGGGENDEACPNCGADLEYDDQSGCKRCPFCEDP